MRQTIRQIGHICSMSTNFADLGWKDDYRGLIWVKDWIFRTEANTYSIANS
jgi:hypothetical protein